MNTTNSLKAALTGLGFTDTLTTNEGCASTSLCASVWLTL
jgi:hypothetical protein